MSEVAEGCIFCKIVSGSLRTEFLVEGDNVVAFRDIAPQAPTHVLIIPKRHLADLSALGRADDVLLGEIVAIATEVAKAEGIDETGFRLVTNVGPDAGQTVHHLHFHLLGGGPLGPLG